MEAYGVGCEACGGTGGAYVHRPSCESDFCVGNGDWYDCGGSWEPCPHCTTEEQVHEKIVILTADIEVRVPYDPAKKQTKFVTVAKAGQRFQEVEARLNEQGFQVEIMRARVVKEDGSPVDGDDDDTLND